MPLTARRVATRGAALSASPTGKASSNCSGSVLESTVEQVDMVLRVALSL